MHIQTEMPLSEIRTHNTISSPHVDNARNESLLVVPSKQYLGDYFLDFCVSVNSKILSDSTKTIILTYSRKHTIQREEK